jgi:hypothetical protein
VPDATPAPSDPTDGERPTWERLTDHPYDPDPDHKRGCFPCCRMAWLLRHTYDDAEHELHRGGISAVEFEAFGHVWATSADRFSSLANGWREPPTDPDVLGVVDAMRKALVVVGRG